VQTIELDRELDRRQLGDVEEVLEFERASWRYGLDFVRESPGRFALLTLRKFFDLWSPIPDAVHKGPEYGGALRDVISWATYIPMLVLAVVGLIITRNQWRRLVPIYLYFITFVAPYALFIPATRYRLPIDFILILFSAEVLVRTWRILPRRDDRDRPLESWAKLAKASDH
jgi:hypothetical protein